VHCLVACQQTSHHPPALQLPSLLCPACRYAADLADNRLLRASLAGFARAGGVVYAECGGLIYLSKSIQPQQDQPPIPMGACQSAYCCALVLGKLQVWHQRKASHVQAP
jgi:hypothetical protein